MQNLITQHLDIWTSAHKTRSSAGRGSSNKLDLYGIKKLRELILELAVRGKLVPQDANDEPASELLKKIATEKEQLIKEGKIKKEKPLPEITDEEKPFELPNNWQWSKLRLIGETNIGLTYKPSNVTDDGVPVLRSSNIQNGKIDLTDLVRVSGVEIKESSIIQVGDLLICARNGSKALVGKTAQIKELSEKTSFGAFMAVFRSRLNNYIEVFLNSPIFRKNLEGVDTTTINQITQGNLIGTLIPIPPLPEQHRIVAKVDELMAFCDQLEQTQSDNIAAHAQLVEALLATLTNSSDHNELQNNWQRIAAHFDTLFTTEHSIDQLKQTILQLAVMGKLVPQDPHDEPASETLKKIAAEKSQLIKDGKIKKEKPLPEITDEEKPFELPSGWKWERFENLVNIQSGITKGRNLTGRKVIEVPYLSVANVQRGFLELQSVKQVEIGIDESDKYAVLKRDLLITEGGDWDKVGRTAIWRGEFPYMAHQNHVFKARLILEKQNEFWLEQYLNSSFAREYFAGSSKQTTNLASINKTQLRGCLIAIPPLPEQYRIVTKVDELMALCDTLKTNLQNAQSTQLALADALVEQAVG